MARSCCTFNLNGLPKQDFQVHDQGEHANCTAHAITACHEILKGCRFRVEDIMPPELLDVGAKPSECVQVLAIHGQRRLEDSKKGTMSMGKNRYHRLSCRELERDLLKMRRCLSQGLPVIVGMGGINWRAFRKSKCANITLQNYAHGDSKHDIRSSLSSSTQKFKLRRSARTRTSSSPSASHRDGDTAGNDDDVIEKHCVCLVGYCDDDASEGGGKFIVLNSHSKEWGSQGFGTISYGCLLSQFIDGFVPKIERKKSKITKRRRASGANNDDNNDDNTSNDDDNNNSNDDNNDYLSESRGSRRRRLL